MNAYNRTINDWFIKIRNGEITLPRFQRFEAWEPWRVAGLLNTVFQSLPSGACLVLEIGDKEPFASRPITGAPETTNRVTEQLLDGQQRLTALWRSLHDDYELRPYYLRVSDDADLSNLDPKDFEIINKKRYTNSKGKLMPLYLDDPAEIWLRRLIPLALLRPEEIATEIRTWVNQAVPPSQESYEQNQSLGDFINSLRTTIREYNLPYLNLPVGTEQAVALDVFVKMNTSSVRLTVYDIVVALVEEETGQSLHELTETLSSPEIRADRYFDTSEITLNVAALLQDLIPSQRGYSNLDYSKLTEDWKVLVDGITWAISFLKELKIYDKERLPTLPPIPALAALHPHLPKNPDQLGRARFVLRQYLWRAFLSDRYDSSSSSRVLVDFRAIRQWLSTDLKALPKCPVFDEEEHPVASINDILKAPWPKKTTTLGRALLALQNLCGADDIADDSPLSESNIQQREYHHCFPDKILKDAGLEKESFLAVNCMLITGRTNRNISAKEPIRYIKERIESVDLPEATLKNRLRSHLMPWDELNVGGYDGLQNDQQLKEQVRTDYEAFHKARAGLLHSAVCLVLTVGTVSRDSVYSHYQSNNPK